MITITRVTAAISWVLVTHNPTIFIGVAVVLSFWHLEILLANQTNK